MVSQNWLKRFRVYNPTYKFIAAPSSWEGLSYAANIARKRMYITIIYVVRLVMLPLLK